MARVGWVVPTAALAALATASLAAVAAAGGRSPEALRPPTNVTVAPAEHVRFTDEREVGVTLVRAQPRSPILGRGGLVTHSSCMPGHPLASGHPVLRLDESVIYALHQSIPPYRRLEVGARGRDVAALQRELVRLGHGLVPDGRFENATRLALRSVEKAAGAARPDGILDPAEVVWLPSAQVTPATCDLAVGQRATAGAAVATLTTVLTAARLSALPPGAVSGARTAVLFGQSIPVRPGTPVVDAAFLARVARTPEYAQSLDAKDADRPRATMTLTTPVEAYKVPPGAVFALNGASGCVESGARAVPVRVVGSGLGASLVTSATPLTSVDVGDGITSRTCGGS